MSKKKKKSSYSNIGAGGAEPVWQLLLDVWENNYITLLGSDAATFPSVPRSGLISTDVDMSQVIVLTLRNVKLQNTL